MEAWSRRWFNPAQGSAFYICLQAITKQGYAGQVCAPLVAFVDIEGSGFVISISSPCLLAPEAAGLHATHLTRRHRRWRASYQPDFSALRVFTKFSTALTEKKQARQGPACCAFPASGPGEWEPLLRRVGNSEFCSLLRTCMNEAVDSTMIQISSSCFGWWSSFICSLRFDLFHGFF